MRTRSTAYAISFAALTAAALVRWLLDPLLHDFMPFVTFMVAIAASAWAGGWRPAALTALLGYLVGAYLFVDPRGTMAFSDPRELLRLAGYLVTAAIIIGFGEAMHAAQHRFETLLSERGGERAASAPTAAAAPGLAPASARPAGGHGRLDLSLLAFGLTLMVLLVGGGLAYMNLRRVAQNESREGHTLEVERDLDLLLRRLTEAETGQRGYLLAEDPKYLEPYQTAIAQIDQILERLRLLTAEDLVQRRRLAQLTDHIAGKRDEMSRTLDLAQADDREGALRIIRSDEGQRLMTEVRGSIGVMRSMEEALMRRRSAESDASIRTTSLLLGLTTILGVLMVCVAFEFSRQSLRVQRRGADLIADERERLRVTLASIGDAVIVTGVDGRIAFLNAVAEALTGWTQSEAAGRPLGEIFHLLDETTRARQEAPGLRAMREGAIVGVGNHAVLVRKDGSERPIDDSASPIRDGRGTVVGCVLVFRDITERRRVERRMRDLLEELQVGDRRKNEFLAILAHELRGPLAPLRNSLEILKRSGGDREVIQISIGTMDRQLRHLVRLVDELIDISRITRDTIELRKDTVELAPVVQQSVEACRPIAESAHQSVSVHLPDEPIRLHADPVRLAQVFGNLLGNASKFTQPGGSIALEAEREGSDVIVKVRDTGIGIPRESLGRVFEMFTQLDQSLERSQGGLGIGLTLVKRLVELHDGSVEAHSEGRGRGSEFVVRLPVIPGARGDGGAAQGGQTPA
ncbi:MAG TPA: CHASE3 domain-containing protein [Candidatus Polarisedimenticolia bacterium]|nr:CHASE3 domain-containing protein [Candidatus Polarisedimenticolia bacterium]